MTTSTTPNHSLKNNLLMDSVLFADDDSVEQILIVDDEAAVRNLFSLCLESSYVCTVAASVEEALELIAGNHFELIITDLIMPELTGVDLVDRVMEISPDTVIIMASGVDNPQSALEAVRRGAFDYLIKPCDMNELEFTVERALQHRRLKMQAQQSRKDLEIRNRQLARGKAELEQLQAQIIHHEKMASLGQLAAGIAHEINNPVGFISGNLDVLKQYIEEMKELTDYYENSQMSAEVAAGAKSIRERIGYESLSKNLSWLLDDCTHGAERISGIVKNLRIFSRLDEAEITCTDIHEGIDSTIRLLSRYYGAGNITLVRDYGSLPPVEAFAGQLNQVWLNILVNAAQAIGTQSGQVTVRTFVDEAFAVIEIRDTGNGIAPENLGRIFEPFFTTKSVGEGTGLGLSISFGIISQHRGTISVESVLKKDTVFSIRLPIKNQQLRDYPTKIN